MAIRRRAFTLVEMLVVVAIIGVLVSLLLPAVQSAREAARRMECTAHLKEIGTAMHTYHAMYQNLPINFGAGVSGMGPDPGTGASYGRSWMLALLPFIDEQRLYDMVDFTQPLRYTDGRTPPIKSNIDVAGTVVELFLCPSDRQGDGRWWGRDSTNQTDYLDIHRIDSTMRNIPFALTNYKASMGSNWNLGDVLEMTEFHNERRNPVTGDRIADEYQVSYWEGRNARESDGLDRGNGIICRGNAGARDSRGRVTPLFPTSLRDITDGTSNTFAVGECVPRWCEKSWWYWYDGATATAALPLNYKPLGNDPAKEDVNNNRGFMSRHLGGGNFCMADGSVKFVDEGIDLVLYRDLANISDGQPAHLPD